MVKKCMWNGKKRKNWETCGLCTRTYVYIKFAKRNKKLIIHDSKEAPNMNKNTFLAWLLRFVFTSYFLCVCVYCTSVQHTIRLICQQKFCLFGLLKQEYVSHSEYVVYFITWSKLIWSLFSSCVFIVIVYVLMCVYSNFYIVVIILKGIVCLLFLHSFTRINFWGICVIILTSKGMKWIYFFFFLLAVYLKNVWQL